MVPITSSGESWGVDSGSCSSETDSEEANRFVTASSQPKKKGDEASKSAAKSLEQGGQYMDLTCHTLGRLDQFRATDPGIA